MPFCGVGVGASAGGFDAIARLLGAMPRESGVAIVIVQHLSADQKSPSAELFGRRSAMEVVDAQAGQRLRPDCAYTIPAEVYASLRNGVLRFEPPPEPRGRRLPIDHFFRSLARDRSQCAIAVVLSGSGSDGVLGVKHIAAHGGMVLAQPPEDAQFDGMPRSAIATGLAAHVVRPEQMPEVMLAYARAFRRGAALRTELRASRQALQGAIDRLEDSNEELGALEQQLHAKILQLETANNELTSLLESSALPMLCLDRSLRIRWFTRAAGELLELMPADLERPISDLGSEVAGESLVRDARAVLERLSPVEHEVRSSRGRWYLRRVLPYRTGEDRVDGVVINFSDITSPRRTADLVLEASEQHRRTLQKRIDVAGMRLSALAAQLSVAEQREREAIAGDLHDNLAQLLHVAKLKLAALHGAADDAARRAAREELEAMLDQAEASVRSLVFQIHPPLLSQLGLAPALEWLAEEMQRAHGLAVELRDDGQAKPLEPARRGVAYRAVRELLINVAKHAGVPRAELELRRSEGAVCITVRDHGRGFDPALLGRSSKKSFGLLSVRERIAYIGGTLDVHSVPGHGTEARLTLPLSAASASAERVAG